ncbi:class I SAM-dependent methyltransferase [Aestuariivivens sediminicola]|uniref:class I SAM-dependent methyltransferase n=1 Tax=Aestuariivivens sediminicola TaxID=2913560 RepID=UPI001F5AEAD5|nr:class I SAM-dependent methyltransferase [Aestuariivivens sediminicola]
MKITDIVKKSVKPPLYTKGNAYMWTDKYISKQLLNVHLNPDIDLASRKLKTIQKTANWILDLVQDRGNINILDLGCGPGLYSELFARKNNSVTGVDISKTSIEYAIQSALDKELDINYINANYLELDLERDQYDLVALIYTDFGVLNPTERLTLLNFVHKVLKKGGIFIFDVLKDTKIKTRSTPKTWEAKESGFWNDTPYLALSESFLYEAEKVILYQHNIYDKDDQCQTYRFWTHFFNEEDISKELKQSKFTRTSFRDDILPNGDIWNGDNVLFSIAEK